MCLIGLVDSGLYSRINVHARRSFVIGMDWHALQTQFPPSRIELRNGPKLHFPSSHSVSTMAAATNPSATPIKGLSTANQKETFQADFQEADFSSCYSLKHLKVEISQNFDSHGGSVNRRYQCRAGCEYAALFGCNRRGGALSQRFETRIVS